MIIQNTLKDKKIAVIGTGVGGAGIAALLAKDGATPVVLERNPFIGGKASTVNIRGCMVDTGIHLTPRGEKGPIAQLAKEVKADLSFVTYDPFLKIRYRGKEATLSSRLGSPLNLVRVFRVINPSVFSIPGAIRFFLRLRRVKREEDLIPCYGISAIEFLSSYITDPDLLSFMAILGGWMHVLPLEDASAADYLWAMSNWFRDGATAYPKGGYSRVCESYLDVCEKNGGRVRLNENVVRIVIANNNVKGIETEKEFIPADIVVSNAGLRKTVELAGENKFPAAYVKKVKSYKEAFGGLVVQYALDYSPLDSLLCFEMKDRLNLAGYFQQCREDHPPVNVPIAFVSPSLADPQLTPPGQHLLLAGTGFPEDILDDERNNAMLDRIEARVIESFPDIEKHIIWKVRHNMKFYAQIGGRGTGEIVGWAQRHDQDGSHRMSAGTPVKGLYVVGTDTGYAGIGTELAAESALRAHKLILEDT